VVRVFLTIDIQIQIEQINQRYALALKSRSIKEFRQLHQWLHKLDEKDIVQDIKNKAKDNAYDIKNKEIKRYCC